MPRNTLIAGGVLVVLGVISYVASAFASVTALIPAFLGVVLVICGLIARKKPMLGVHVALVVALLGLVGTFMNVLKIGEVFAGTAERPLAVVVSAITFVLLLIYIALGVRSFVAARRWKKADAISQA
ncbi:hypothetical protein [Mycetocola miduiensis]|uniref:Uncharacterized protein n=1 Tax=Mycetocola miduiensis TaxID=995034 RepID=A0A1I4YJY7_9MICO|nr:hypothetical protein [Mycetocola miduiensis]SFN38277.1 hypothetical protein SAMN05216219_0297 [Mycetocola miduiensis]